MTDHLRNQRRGKEAQEELGRKAASLHGSICYSDFLSDRGSGERILSQSITISWLIHFSSIMQNGMFILKISPHTEMSSFICKMEAFIKC